MNNKKKEKKMNNKKNSYNSYNNYCINIITKIMIYNLILCEKKKNYKNKKI